MFMKGPLTINGPASVLVWWRASPDSILVWHAASPGSVLFCHTAMPGSVLVWHTATGPGSVYFVSQPLFSPGLTYSWPRLSPGLRCSHFRFSPGLWCGQRNKNAASWVFGKVLFDLHCPGYSAELNKSGYCGVKHLHIYIDICIYENLSPLCIE